jgi:hypothetical protein
MRETDGGQGVKRIGLVLLFAPALLFAIDGTVVNRTSGKPQPNATVELMKLGAGMDTVGTVKTDAQGHFEFKVPVEQVPYLVQAQFGGVHYNKMIPPGTPSTGVTVDIFDVSNKPGDAKVAEHVLFVQPGDAAVQVNEIVEYQNAGKTTFYDSKNGTVRFFLPASTKGEARVSVNTANSMPLQRSADKTPQADVYTVDSPVKPGQTRFDIVYQVPAGQPLEFRILDGSKAKVVVPSGVTLTGDGLTQLGAEPQTKAVIYDMKAPKVIAKLEGTGSLQAAASAGEGASEEDTGGGIESKKPMIYERLYWILGLTLAMLVLGGAMLYRKELAAKVARR